MSDYSKTTNFTAKDSLLTGDPNKVIKGSDHDTEYDNIETAVGTKANKIVGGVTNDLMKQTAAGDLATAGFAMPNVSDNITASHVELNLLDGATFSTAEANYLTGVTSALQTQLDAKQPLDADLTAIAALANTDGNFIVGNGSAWVAESGATVRTSLGLGSVALLNSISQSELDTDSVGQAQIKTTYQQVSGAYSASTPYDTEFTATGGIYVIGHTINIGNTSGDEAAQIDRYVSTTGSYLSKYRATASTDLGSSTVTFRLYYINSSPPYDLGDGDIPLFVYAIIDNATGEIESLSTSVDPSWAYNGPTDVVPTRYGRDGKVYKKIKDRSGLPFPNLNAALAAGGAARNEYRAALKEIPLVEVELTQAMKNADMNIVPHPFVGNKMAGKTVVMFDPVSPVVQELYELQEEGEDISQIIHGGYLSVGNSNLNRQGPAGLMIPSVAWK